MEEENRTEEEGGKRREWERNGREQKEGKDRTEEEEGEIRIGKKRRV